MPYVTNAQKEWAGWSDLSSAVDRICAADDCEELAAAGQLRLAIADGNVRTSWADQQKRYVDSPVFDTATPPTNARWWLNQAEFDVRGRAISEEDEPERIGLVKDFWCLAPLYTGEIGSVEGGAVWKWIEESPSLRNTRLSIALDRVRFRPLLIWFPNLDALWPLPARGGRDIQQVKAAVYAPASSAPGGVAGSTPVHLDSLLPTKRPVAMSEIIAACREIYKAHSDNPPNVNEAYALVRKMLKTTTRQKIREALNLREFTALRRKPGIRKRSRPEPDFASG